MIGLAKNTCFGYKANKYHSRHSITVIDYLMDSTDWNRKEITGSKFTLMILLVTG